MTNIVALRMIGIVSLAVVAGLISFATTSSRAGTGADSKIFERSIHGSYETITLLAPLPAKRIEAAASATGRGGYIVRRFRARYRALAKWRIAAADKYGPGSTRWTLARNKSVDCNSRASQVTCTVSALPATPLQRLGL